MYICSFYPQSDLPEDYFIIFPIEPTFGFIFPFYHFFLFSILLISVFIFIIYHILVSSVLFGFSNFLWLKNYLISLLFSKNFGTVKFP